LEVAVAVVEHVTLTANTVATVSLAGNFGQVEVLNRDGVAEVYFTTDGAAPTVGGANCHVLPAAVNSVDVLDETSGTNSVVKLISAGTPKVSVRGL
jgi:hypothetical protein